MRSLMASGKVLPRVAEPDWSQVAVYTIDEYFSGERYARYSVGTSIEMNSNCQVTHREQRSVFIDDGKYLYDLDLTKGKGKKRKRLD